MKKFFYLFSVIAMTIVSFSLVGCSKSDPVAEEEEKPAPKPNYAMFEIKAVEDMFELGDFIVTIEYDDQKLTYTLDETTKVKNISFDAADGIFERNPLPGRVLKIEPFEFKTHPVKYTGKFVFTEEAKKRMAEAPEEDQIDFGVYAKLQTCNKDGIVIIPGNPKDDTRLFSGVYVNGFDAFLDVMIQENATIFSQKL